MFGNQSQPVMDYYANLNARLEARFAARFAAIEAKVEALEDRQKPVDANPPQDNPAARRGDVATLIEMRKFLEEITDIDRHGLDVSREVFKKATLLLGR